MGTMNLGRWTGTLALSACTLLLLTACSGGSSGDTGPAGPPGPPGPGAPGEVGPFDPLPGIHVNVVALQGNTGGGGSFAVGNTMTVRYTLKDDAGADVVPTALDAGEIYVSGPTSNYQRVIAKQSDLLSASTFVGGGVWAYTFPVAIPSTYLPPLNDSPSFGASDGELAGQALLAGTYSVGLAVHKVYTVDAKEYTDAGADVEDFLVGGPGSIVARQVVQNDNCNVCHTQLRVHDGTRRDVRLCVLCHTAGAEDSNVAGATPGVTIEFKVMVHRIHNGEHLPSVLGVSTNSSGDRLYPGMVGAVAPKPLAFSDDAGDLADFSAVAFPVWPNLNVAMPRDAGYSALSSTDPDGAGPLLSQRANEDMIRTGVTACLKCHGDPDAGGALTAPAQGNQFRTNPSQRVCASCHDDVDWAKPYTANGQTMAPGLSDATCTACHADTAANQATPGYKSISITDAHVHPLNDAALDPGVNSVVTAVTGGTGPLGQFQIGEGPTVQFTLKNDAGANIGLATMDSGAGFFFGPNTNRQLIMPLTSANGMTLSPYDFAGRLHSPSSANKGTMSKAFLGTPAVAETLVVEFSSATVFGVTGTVSGSLGGGTLAASPSTNPSGSSVSAFELGSGIAATETLTIAFSTATAFSVTGSTSGVLGSGSLPATLNASTRFSSPKVSFNIAVGTTAFAAGNQFNAVLFQGGAADPVMFVVVAGRTSFAAKDRFYYELVPNAATYTLRMPMDMVFEYLGDGSGAAGQVVTAANLPVYYGRQQVWEAATTVTTTTTTASVAALARKVTISPITGLVNGDTVVIEPAGGLGVREYVQIAPERSDGVISAVGDTTVALNFKTPLRYAHGSVTVTKVTLALKQEGAANGYTLNPATGTVTSVVAFTAATGVVASYRTDGRFGYRRHAGDGVQAYYVPPANDSAAIGQEQGDWSGLPYQSGTYTVDLWLYKNIDLGLQNELQTYRSTSNAGTKDFLFGTATTIVPHEIVAQDATCYTCHNDLIFHGGGRRGLDACLTCHSISGNEDKPRWDTPKVGTTTTDTALTPGVAIEFRQMLHKIHRGEELANAATYTVVGNGGNPSQYGEVVFPAMPGGVKQCVRCHGNDAWKEPKPRVNAFATFPTRVWSVVCGSCHDDTTAQAHIASNVSGTGYEACEVCHGPGKVVDVAKVHTAK